MLKKLSGIFLKPLLQWYIKQPRHYSKAGFSLIIQPGVFHPGLFFSTDYFFSFLQKQPMQGRSVCEVGCGSGLLSLLACSKSANVTALDISQTAVSNTAENYERNRAMLNGRFTVLQSNLFSSVSPQTFDTIIINPPYFFKEAHDESQHAWNCGTEGEYFENLFGQLPHYSHKQSYICMILANNCDIQRIQSIAQKYNCTFVLEEQKKIYWEINFIYRLHY